MTVDDSLSLGEASGREWDVVVVGGGPAGSVCAHQLAQRGRRVLLVDRERHPRWKVCGGCLSGRGVSALRSMGLGGVLDGAPAPTVGRTVLRAGQRKLDVPMGGMVAVSREALDARLMEQAIGAGAAFLGDVKGTIDAQSERDGLIELRRGASVAVVRAGAVVDARGLSRSGGAGGAGGARIGVGATVEDERGGTTAREHTLTMCIGRSGYVGRVRLGDGRINWGAAVDPRVSRDVGLRAALCGIWRECGLDVGDVPHDWRGTPRLMQRRSAQRGRVMRVGDAGGYVEPITGEGMTWAIVSGAACASTIVEGDLGRHGWARASRGLLGWRQRRCALVARAVRSPGLLRASLAIGASVPELSAVMARLSIGERGLVP